VPGFGKVRENDFPSATKPESHSSVPAGMLTSPGSAAFDLLAVTVWATLPTFFHVTLSPAATSISFGSNVSWSFICTTAPASELAVGGVSFPVVERPAEPSFAWSSSPPQPATPSAPSVITSASCLIGCRTPA
jgi:hypothetical protein